MRMCLGLSREATDRFFEKVYRVVRVAVRRQSGFCQDLLGYRQRGNGEGGGGRSWQHRSQRCSVYFADLNAALRARTEEVTVTVKGSHKNDPEKAALDFCWRRINLSYN